MSQDRWPRITTSVSGISTDDWDLFKKTAKDRGLKYQAAMERCVAELIADIRSGRKIEWLPSRPEAASKPIAIHIDTLEEVRNLAKAMKYRQNVVFLTAMSRWINSRKSWKT